MYVVEEPGPDESTQRGVLREPLESPKYMVTLNLIHTTQRTKSRLVHGRPRPVTRRHADVFQSSAENKQTTMTAAAATREGGN